jgi:hypothetical protein
VRVAALATACHGCVRGQVLLGVSTTQEQEGRKEGRTQRRQQGQGQGLGRWATVDGPLSLGQCPWSVSMVNATWAASHNKEGTGRATEQRSGGAP